VHFKSECRSENGREEKANLVEAICEEASPLLMVFEDEAMDILLQCLAGEMPPSNVWFLDISATSHMTGHRSYFSYQDITLTCIVEFEAASRIKYESRGTIKVKCI